MAIKEAKVAVVGGRNFLDYNFLKGVLNSYHRQHIISVVVSGGARGADSLAERWAHTNQVDLHVFMAKWNQYGNKAGYKRNLLIAEYADLVIAFPDKQSKGTYHTIGLFERFNKPCYVFKYWEA